MVPVDVGRHLSNSHFSCLLANTNLMNRTIYKAFGLILLLGLLSACEQPKGDIKDGSRPLPYILDMVYSNPGEATTVSEYNNPAFVRSRGYNGMVVQWYVNCAITYDNFEKNIVPEGSNERRWIESRASDIDKKLKVIDSIGIDVYAFVDMFVAPRSIWDKYGRKMGAKETDLHGYGGDVENVRKPLVENEMIEKLIVAQIDGIFTRFPSIDGLVIRFGETYLHDTPFHMGGKPVREGDKGIGDHVKLLNILRDEVCVKRNKKIFYRTWDFGWFHTRPDIYLAITNQIEPHENLIFSIKHTKGDFLRTFPFNPTLGIGKHPQIVEVQCQREYEGKGAHPDYIADGVINGFEEYAGDPNPKCLNDLRGNPLLKGVWTWSRGGGWKGPYITNELWCDLNAYVMSSWARDTDLTESEFFSEYTKILGLSEKDAEAFRRVSTLSAHGVLIGRSSKITRINPWWIRDQYMGGLTSPDFNSYTEEAWGKLNRDFVEINEKGIVDDILKEKAEAVNVWREIESLSEQITTGDEKFRDYLRVSCKYGRIKYEIIQQAWIVMLKGMEGDKKGTYDVKTIHDAYLKYVKLWNDFRALKAGNEQCATLYFPYSFSNRYKELHCDEGMDKAVKKYVKLVEHREK